jgi:iron(III) transport system substrate-binding protein
MDPLDEFANYYLSRNWLTMSCLRLFILGLLLSLAGCRSSSKDRVVVYCALDREFAEPILKEFTQKTGLGVVPRWDTEANKSVGLYSDLVSEQSRPRCDVHWNNEILATIRLQRQGILQPYASPSTLPFPAVFKAKDSTWTAFAARARVLLINTKLLPKKEDWPIGLNAFTDPKWKGQFAMARPLFGTTATQAACLFQLMGTQKAEEYYHQVHQNGVVILPGNKQVAVAVGQGKVAFGITDTDDAYAEVDQHNPVALVYPDPLPSQPAKDEKAPRFATLFVPNTVALIKNCPNPEGGKKFIDFVLRPEVEEQLAKGESRQIPLNPNVQAPDLRVTLPDWQQYGQLVDFGKIVDRWDDAQRFLAKEFALQ